MNDLDPALAPRVRYVIPSFNQARYIGHTIRSLLDQDYPALDVVVMDGASTDGTVDVLRSIESPRLRWVSEPDRGQSDAILKGLALEGRPYAFFNWLGSDDLLRPGAVRRLVEVALRTGADVVCAEGEYIDEEGRVIGRYDTGPVDLQSLQVRCTVCQPSVLIRTEAYRRAGGLPPQWQSIMDYALWLELHDAGALFVRDDAFVSAYRIHLASKTASWRKATYEELFRLATSRGRRISKKFFEGAFLECIVQPVRGVPHLPANPIARIPWRVALRGLRALTLVPALQAQVPRLFRRPTGSWTP